MKHIILLPLLLLNILYTVAQSGPVLKVGDRLTGKAWEMLPVKEPRKLIVLDFWSTWCSSCMGAFPEMEALQKQFNSELQIIAVNSYEDTRDINKRLDKLNASRSKWGGKPFRLPELPSINGDTVLKSIFPYSSVPHHIWLDGTGKVLAITNGYNTNVHTIEATLRGEQVILPEKRDLLAEGYDSRKEGLFKVAHEVLTPVYYTGFLYYQGGLGGGNATETDSLKKTFRRSWYNCTPLSFYTSAALHWPQKLRRVVTLRDRERFEWPEEDTVKDNWYKKNLFSYEMVIPLEEKERLGVRMLKDLNGYIGELYGIEGVVEDQTLPAWKFSGGHTEAVKSKSRGKSRETVNGVTHFNQYPFKVVLNSIRNTFEGLDRNVVFIDSCDIDPDLLVDMKLTINSEKPHLLKKDLEAYGFILQETTHREKVLHVKDKFDADGNTASHR